MAARKRRKFWSAWDAILTNDRLGREVGLKVRLQESVNGRPLGGGGNRFGLKASIEDFAIINADRPGDMTSLFPGRQPDQFFAKPFGSAHQRHKVFVVQDKIDAGLKR